VSADSKNFVEAIQGLRGVAALTVLIVHLQDMPLLAGFLPPIWPWLEATVNMGGHGVELFFMISGFLIPASLMRHRSVGKFFLDRALRGEYRGRIAFADHHESLAAGAFFSSPFEEAAILTLDGSGEWSAGTLGAGRGNRVTLTHEIRSPAGRRQLVRAEYADGVVTPVGGHGSHLIGDLASSDALVVVPEDVTAVAAGEQVQVLRLDEEF